MREDDWIQNTLLKSKIMSDVSHFFLPYKRNDQGVILDWSRRWCHHVQIEVTRQTHTSYLTVLETFQEHQSHSALRQCIMFRIPDVVLLIVRIISEADVDAILVDYVTYRWEFELTRQLDFKLKIHPKCQFSQLSIFHGWRILDFLKGTDEGHPTLQ